MTKKLSATTLRQLLLDTVAELHWASRRYCDGRSTYAASSHNAITRRLLDAGIPVPTPDGAPWARDGMGRAYDGLSDEEAAAIESPSVMEREVFAEVERLRRENAELRERLALPWGAGNNL